MSPLSSSSFPGSYSPPYYAVVFTTTQFPLSQHPTGPHPSYSQMASRMSLLASQQPGYLGEEGLSTRSKGTSKEVETDGITISYWRTREDILNWKNLLEHKEAQEMGMKGWYKSYKVRICKVEKEYGFDAKI